MQEPSSGGTGQWNEYADRLRQQLPELPDALLDGYVSWAPWIALIFGGIGLIVLIFATILGAAFLPFLAYAGAYGAGATAFLSIIFGFANSILDVAGGYLMRQRRLMGWWLLALGLIVSILSNIVSISLLGLILTLLIGWIHLKVKPRYS